MGNADPVRNVHIDWLAVHVYQTRDDMGAAAASHAAGRLRAALERQRGARVVFASAPSQIEFLHALAGAPDIDWGRVTVFHLDEYLEVSSDAPQAFGRFLREHLFDRVRPGTVRLLDGSAGDAPAEASRYARLLAEAPLDLACVGIGENGHLAFNEPADTDFDDPALVRIVAIDVRSREQQVHDGCFPRLDAVPERALTLTVPAIMAARAITCIVPGPTKREAVRRMVRGPVSTECPASALRRHHDAVLFTDAEAASAL
jgi:glucosamine-6-phosphate deaminase